MNENVIISDNYSKAYSLDKKIKANTQVLQETIFELGKNLMEMRDGKLYKELGYQNFAEYCENEIGIKRRQAYNYISISENLPEDFVQSTAHSGVEKLSILSRLDEVTRTEITEKTDLNSTTVKELKEEIKKLKEENSDYKDEIEQLEMHIDKLESQPKDVVVAEPVSRDVKNMEKAMEKLNIEFEERYDRLQEDNEKEVLALNRQHTAEIARIQEEHKAEISAVRSEYDKKLADVNIPDTKETFKAYLANAVDALNRLLNFVEFHGNDDNFPFYISKIDETINIIKSRQLMLSEKE